MTATSSSAAASIMSFLARPLSLLRHVAHGCAGYLGLSRAPCPSPGAGAAAAKQGVDGGDEAVEEEVVVVQVRSRAMPQRPRELREGRGGRGGAHN